MEIGISSYADTREVLRCIGCRLVQFRPLTNLCRRCDKPFPSSLSLEPISIVIATAHTKHNHRHKIIRKFSIGRRLKLVRELNNLTQMDLAAKTKMPRTYISRIENSRLLPGPWILQRLADELEISILDLLPINAEEKHNPKLPELLYWNSLVRCFLKLENDQIAIVISRVRAMVDHNGIGSQLKYFQQTSDSDPSPLIGLAHN